MITDLIFFLSLPGVGGRLSFRSGLTIFKREVGNTILNTKGLTVFPLFSICNKYTGVT